ncbi:TetR/AcrR family transcriptional regulator [Streptomyces sp. NBC_01497]|uniref:TetR/AcrR family transcriptional regulator n=1 Tax=Streptomyces sp. NBC_01497 TaxID=2903885 RepID=UPI002E2EC347|nr:helix-turn-helix domain-containing protein [Streptomyces sp. NBC_01497]
MTRRPYRSTVRERSAATTRNSILDAAEALFAEHGYARVSITRVAEVADVAQGTVYAAFGSKPSLVVALMERAAGDETIIRTTSAVRSATSGPEIVALTVAGAGEIVRRHARTMAVLYDNASADPHITAAVGRAENLQRERFDLVSARLAELGLLRDGMTRADATRVLEYYTGPGSWRRLRSLEWSWRHAEEWLADQVSYAVLGVSGTA